MCVCVRVCVCVCVNCFLTCTETRTERVEGVQENLTEERHSSALRSKLHSILRRKQRQETVHVGMDRMHGTEWRVSNNSSMNRDQSPTMVLRSKSCATFSDVVSVEVFVFN